MMDNSIYIGVMGGVMGILMMIYVEIRFWIQNKKVDAFIRIDKKVHDKIIDTIKTGVEENNRVHDKIINTLEEEVDERKRADDIIIDLIGGEGKND